MLSVKTTCRKNYFLTKFCTIFKDINKIIFKHIFKAQIGISFKNPNKMFKLFLLELAILNCFLMHSRTLLSQPSAYSRLFPYVVVIVGSGGFLRPIKRATMWRLSFLRRGAHPSGRSSFFVWWKEFFSLLILINIEGSYFVYKGSLVLCWSVNCSWNWSF